MNTQGTAWVVAVVPIVVGLSGLVWAVASWRLSGPSLRIHCLAYRNVVLIRVFNAGRVPDSVEHMVLGGMRGGNTGYDLTEPLQLPIRLGPGESHRWRLNAHSTEISHLSGHLRGGWSSLWILTGSMRQRRAEVLPVAADEPLVGWRLVPRRVYVSRYLPAAGALVTTIVTVAPGASLASWLTAAMGFVVFTRGLVVFSAPRPFKRQRFERWILAGIGVACLVLFTRGLARPTQAELPPFDTGLLLVSWVAAYVSCVPGAAAAGIQFAAATRARWTRATDRLRSLARRHSHAVSVRFSRPGTARLQPVDGDDDAARSVLTHSVDSTHTHRRERVDIP